MFWEILLLLLFIVIIIILSLLIIFEFYKDNKQKIIFLGYSGSGEKTENMFIDPQYTKPEKSIIKNLCTKFLSDPSYYFNDNSLILDLNQQSPLEYRETKDLFRISLHLGQRKLLLSELLFITKYIPLVSNTKYTIIYAGAAPGHHIFDLSQLYPNINFILYDPSDFDKGLSSLNNVQVNQVYFTNEIAEELYEKYKGEMYFISDIRISTSLEEQEEQVDKDMLLQQEWVKIMKPIYSMLKFRLPWQDKIITYFPGVIYKQAFPPLKSTETRLVVSQIDINNLIEYNSKPYNDLLYYHNVIIREWTNWDFYAQSLIAEETAKKLLISPQYILNIINKFNNQTVEKFKTEGKSICEYREELYKKYYKKFHKFIGEKKLKREKFVKNTNH